MMRYLGIETSEDRSAVALVEDDTLVADDTFNSRRVLCDELMKRILAICGGELAIDGIAVSSGPGSFTGLRIGVATAKALGHALSISVVPVPTQHVYALSVATDDEARVVGVIQRARVGHCYAGLYGVRSGTVDELTPAALIEYENAWDVVGTADCLLQTASQATASSW
jgi:tRNA threonylcarbamoyladenosine biosynthesis protein TsaB